MRGDSDYEIPEVRYDDHYRYLTSVWASVLVLLIATVLFQILHVMVDSVAALSQASRGGSDDERQPLAGSNGQPRGEYDSGGGRGDQQRTTFMGMGERDRSTLSNRLRRAVDTCQRALLVLLTAVTFLSVPLQTKCYPNIPDTPPPTPPPPSPPPVLPPPPFEMLSRGGHHDFHHSCLTNSLSLSSVILAWVFTALSVLWAAIDSFAVGGMPGALAGVVLGGVSFPVVVAMFFVGLGNWPDMDSARTQARAIVTNVDRNISALADATSAAIDSLSTSLLPPTHPRSIPVSEPAVPQPDDAFIDPFADPSDDENMNPIRTGPAAAPIRQQSQPAPIQPAVQQQNPLPVQSNPLPLPTLLGNPLVPASIQQSYAKSPFVNAMSAASNSFNKAFVQPGAHKVYPYEVEQERRRMLAAQAGQGGQREGNGQGVRVVYVQGQQVMPVNVQHEEPLPVYRSEKN